jgi:hypothetical protein
MKMMNESRYDLVEGTDYEFIYSEEDPEATVKLLSGEYSDVCIKFSNVSVKEDDGEAYLNFNFDIIDANGSLFLEENLDFKNYMGDILTSIIWKNIIDNKE